MKKRILSLLLCLIMVIGVFPAAAFADEAVEAGELVTTTPVSVTVDFTAQATGAFLCAPQFGVSVSSDLAESYGFEGDLEGKVSVLDVLVKAHEIVFGDDFTKETVGDYIEGAASWISSAFGKIPSLGFAVNGACPNDGVYNEKWGAYTAYVINQAEVKSGDVVELFTYQDENWLDNYVWFTKNDVKISSLNVMPNEEFTLGLEGYCYCFYNCSNELNSHIHDIECVQLALVDSNGHATEIEGKVTDEEGKVTLSLPTEGNYTITAIGTDDNDVPVIMPILRVTAAYPDACITAPSDATVFVGQKDFSGYNYQKFTTIEPAAVVNNADDTKTYYYDIAKNKYFIYKVSGEDYVTYSELVESKKADFTRTITLSDLKPVGKTKATIERDVAINSGYNVADIYLNINPQGYLKLEAVGNTHQMINLRNWEAVNSVTANHFIEPDYHYAVIDESGNPSNSVIEISESGLITAKANGVAIVLVTYDAMSYKNGIGGPFFGAIWPENTGVFVVSVGADDSGIQTGMTINEGKSTEGSKLAGDFLDAEHDVIYFTGESGEYTFTPGTEGVSVSVANPTVTEKLAFTGFVPVNANEDGSFTVTLKRGRNIIKLFKGEKTEYQVITAKPVTITINNGADVHPGDALAITLEGLFHPANKLAGVYNMNATVRYDDVPGYKTIGALSKQYNFASTAHALIGLTEKDVMGNTTYAKDKKINFSIPVDWAENTYTLSGGNFYVGGFGDHFGNHRGISLTEGKAPNLNANVRSARMGSLPDIVVPITLSAEKTVTGIEITTLPTKTAYFAGEKFAPAGMVVHATYADETEADVTSYSVSPEIITAYTTEITVSYGGKSAKVPVTITPVELTSIAITSAPTKTAYIAGEAFDPNGMVVTASYNNGKTGVITDYTITPQRALEETDTEITVAFAGMSATTTITVAAAPEIDPEAPSNITVYFTLYGDGKHGEPEGSADTHTLKDDNLLVWIARTGVTVSPDAKVIDVVSRALGLAGIPYVNDGGNYISSIRGLAEQDNGPLSGWMYTLNGTHGKLGVGEQTLRDGDEIVFHYTDDYTKEQGSEEWGGTPYIPDDEPAPVAPKEPIATPNPFKDIEDCWAADAIQYAFENGLMKGVGDDNFDPEGIVTRAMVVTTLYRIENEPEVKGENPFTDVETGKWYTDAVLWAAENGIISGYGSRFSPNGTLTREQFAVMLYNYAMFKGYDVTKSNELSSYDDAASISPWALTAMQWANAEGLVTGRTASTLVPSGTATRAEMASLLQRFCETVAK